MTAVAGRLLVVGNNKTYNPLRTGAPPVPGSPAWHPSPMGERMPAFAGIIGEGVFLPSGRVVVSLFSYEDLCPFT